MFHFLIALALLSRIDYEAMALNVVSVILSYFFVLDRPLDGVLVFHDKWGVTAVTLALGVVEFLSEFESDDRDYFKVGIVVAAVISISFIGLPLLFRLFFFKMTDGSTYKEVIEKDGSVGCLLTGEVGTGLRGADWLPGNVGVGPL